MQSVILPNDTQIDKGNRIFDGVFEQSLEFRVKMPYDAAIQFIRRIGGYNEFRSDRVIDALESIDRIIPRRFYNSENPNNGERSYDISVGREGSPVIYIELYEWVFADRLDDPRIKAICNIATVDGLADEVDSTIDSHTMIGGSRKITFRFWWD